VGQQADGEDDGALREGLQRGQLDGRPAGREAEDKVVEQTSDDGQGHATFVSFQKQGIKRVTPVASRIDSHSAGVAPAPVGATAVSDTATAPFATKLATF
jgi:hypothetical protein